MSLEDIQTTLLKALEEAATPRGIDIVDVELAGTRTAPVIRLRIDHLDETLPTITLDEVAAQSEWINEVLDSLDRWRFHLLVLHVLFAVFTILSVSVVKR